MENVFEKTKYILQLLEGMHESLKMIHWNTTCKAEHLLTDDIDGEVLEFEDDLAEISMGLSEQRYGEGDLKSLLPDAKDLIGILKEIESEIEDYKKEVDESSISNCCDDFLQNINKWKYLATFK